MNRKCSTCDHDKRDCDPIRCIEGGLLTNWKPRTVFADFAEAGDYRDALDPDHFHAVPRDGQVIVSYKRGVAP